ncbi:streptomycin biosynthesis protein StrI [Deinococcus piscis]|uniref:Streptomycin biosynthesis protein StrI n=1 Tax=Deinococcus piscis TaxID=394230 RepID=A0ABQ3KBA3_9DEIO|nr:Gfo/Idh/MocA family oxidoreductase [Deinococcus piscis]GHG11450.1 streptomycin biosynthesis protein StrI [Deinococcus piscis]
MTLRVAIIGCGNRGADVYAQHLREQGAQVSHLVDPRPERLAEVAARFGVPPEHCFADADAFFGLGRVADAVVIATPDGTHTAPCLRALALNYHVLLEKPVALDESELHTLLAAETASAGRVSVCHVLRATPFFREVTAVIRSGRLGQIIGLQLNENVAYWHYAHSYVRGNWRSSPPAAPFILAKSSHDLDLLRWWAAAPPLRVSSAGGLHHFRPEQAPAGAAQRCLDCPVKDCPSDARVIYGTRDPQAWPVTVLTAGGHSVQQALEDTPYGECVYLGHNNVCDHQSVTVEFAGGVTATLTTTAFTHNNTRTLKVMGSHGELRGQMELGELEWYDFRSGTGRESRVQRWSVDVGGNHGGGDAALVHDWLAFLRGESDLPTPLAESLDSHRLAFAAERARLSGTVEQL